MYRVEIEGGSGAAWKVVREFQGFVEAIRAFRDEDRSCERSWNYGRDGRVTGIYLLRGAQLIRAA